jgi:hypothetical protein
VGKIVPYFLENIEGEMDNWNVKIKITAVSLFSPAGRDEAALGQKVTGQVPDFKARKLVPDRKSLKLMTQAVRLGVACIADVVSKVPYWESIPPERRGIYVGASPQVGRHDDLTDAIDASYQSGEFSLSDFGSKGIDLINPLWLVRGLSNNVLGFSSAYHNVQGHNMSYCMGEDGGLNAIKEAIYALLDHRVDIAIAGGSDALVEASEIMGVPCSEASAFFVFERGGDEFAVTEETLKFSDVFGGIGAAKWPVALALQEFSKQ